MNRSVNVAGSENTVESSRSLKFCNVDLFYITVCSSKWRLGPLYFNDTGEDITVRKTVCTGDLTLNTSRDVDGVTMMSWMFSRPLDASCRVGDDTCCVMSWTSESDDRLSPSELQVASGLLTSANARNRSPAAEASTIVSSVIKLRRSCILLKCPHKKKHKQQLINEWRKWQNADRQNYAMLAGQHSPYWILAIAMYSRIHIISSIEEDNSNLEIL